MVGRLPGRPDSPATWRAQEVSASLAWRGRWGRRSYSSRSRAPPEWPPHPGAPRRDASAPAGVVTEHLQEALGLLQQRTVVNKSLRCVNLFFFHRKARINVTNGAVKDGRWR